MAASTASNMRFEPCGRICRKSSPTPCAKCCARLATSRGKSAEAASIGLPKASPEFCHSCCESPRAGVILTMGRITGMADYDLAIIGGGINGAGIARDAAGRGFRVLLVEQNDLASGTSSASTKLIHGGLRYLEHGWLRLVREALAEREVMLRMAPHLVRPQRFVLPVEPGMRPRVL